MCFGQGQQEAAVLGWGCLPSVGSCCQPMSCPQHLYGHLQCKDTTGKQKTKTDSVFYFLYDLDLEMCHFLFFLHVHTREALSNEFLCSL